MNIADVIKKDIDNRVSNVKNTVDNIVSNVTEGVKKIANIEPVQGVATIVTGVKGSISEHLVKQSKITKNTITSLAETIRSKVKVPKLR